MPEAPPSCNTQNSSKCYQISPVGKKSPVVENHHPLSRKEVEFIIKNLSFLLTPLPSAKMKSWFLRLVHHSKINPKKKSVHIIHHINRINKSHRIISIDKGKAFEETWTMLHDLKNLSKIGTEGHFLSLVNVMYNGKLLNVFPWRMETRHLVYYCYLYLTAYCKS